jgi:hypothetical protein
MNMNNNVVTPITRAQSVVHPTTPADVVHTLDPRPTDDDVEVVIAAFRSAGLHADLQALWSTYPNLHHSTLAMLKMYSTSWPSSDGGEEADCAVVKAVKTALSLVKSGIHQGETDRAHVIANYLSGLVTIASDIVAVHAWGFNRNRPVERLIDFDVPFREWEKNGAFTEVRFLAQHNPTKTEVDGTRMKLLCAIASTKDVGVYARFR